jgi:hypothetical protein
MSSARMNGKPGTFPGKPGDLGSGAMYLFRIRDTNRCESGMTDAAEAAFEHGQFTLKFGRHYHQWPGINASCLRQPALGGVLMVRLISDLPAETVNQSVLELLEQLNLEHADSGLRKPRFQLLDPIQVSGTPPVALRQQSR